MPKVRKYDAKYIEMALTEINGGLSIHAAARKFNIPRSTIQNRMHNRAKKSSFGPSPILTKDEEDQIVDWLLANHAKGFPRRKEDVQSAVKDFLDAMPRSNPFINNLPGDKWYESFLKRNSILSIRTPEPITDASSKVAETNIRGWFRQVETYFKDKNYLSILEDPSRIFNGDETNFLMCPKSGKVLAPKGTKNVYETDRGQAKENLTVMFSFSASGFIVPPLIVYPYKRVPTIVINSIPSGLKWLKSDSGWMTTDVFFEYIKDIFYPSVVAQNVEFPVILYVDGHRTHLTYKLSKLCESLKIILICLYPNSTRILQPADVSIFKPLKTGWQKTVLNWRKKNIDSKLTKCCFAPILKTVVDNYINTNSIINGFRTCGLQPFNPDAIDYSKCLGKNSVQDEYVAHEEQNNYEGNTINFEKFKEIVGQEKLDQLENATNPPNTEDFLILLRIYQEFNLNSNQNKEGENTFLFDHDEGKEDNGDNEFDVPNQIENPDNNHISLEYQELTVETIDGLNEAMSQEIQSIEFIDEFLGPENYDSAGIPVIHVDDPKVQIGNFFVVPQTPVRMGTKSTERRTFIISSTPFQKAEEDKIYKKNLAEIEKEHRIKERKIKKEQKAQDASLKQLRKAERIAEKLQVRSKPIKNRRAAKYSSLKLQAGNKNICLPKKLNTNENINKIKTAIIDDKPSEEQVVEIEETEPHVRKLFVDDFDGNDKTLFNNNNEVSGMCFQCARHIDINKPGLSCKSCNFRNYHVDCAGQNFDQEFNCPACISKQI